VNQSENWLDRFDRRWNGTVVPFVFGMAVGMALMTVVFVVCAIVTHGQ